jgi:putative nucleotidyltransferase with HDIG domain
MIRKLKKIINQRRDLGFISRLGDRFPQGKIYLVGGAIRDLLMGKKIADLDFVVEGVEKEKLAGFLANQGSVKEVESRAFGVFIFSPQESKRNFDIALTRSERWTGEGYKDLEVDTSVSIEEDLGRRDFTINALAVNLADFKLFDPFNGQKDLKRGIIRSVGRAKDRFQEDPSRILRGVRFGCQLDFKIERDTLGAMADKSEEIIKKLPNGKSRVAEELIAEEFLKSFDSDAVRTIKLYDQTGVLKILLPEVEAMKGVKQPSRFHAEGDVFIHSLLVLQKLEEIRATPEKIIIPELVEYGLLDRNFSIELKLSALLHDIGKPATFTPPTEEKDRISFNEHDDIGAEMAGRIIDRLKLTVFPKKNRLHVDREQVVWLVKKHMILVVAKPEEMRLSTLEKYFFNPDGRGQKLMTLSYCDISATIPPSGKPDYLLLKKFLKKINQVKEKVKAKQKEDRLPPPLLDGREIMELLGLESGPKIGEIKDRLRDKELAGELKDKREAQDWLKKKGESKD